MNQVVGVLSRALDASALRQKVIANNIANADTPNFQPSRVVFEDLLQDQLANSSFVGKRTNDRQIAIGNDKPVPSATIVTQRTVMNNNGNGVDLDYEMTKMGENSIWYQSLVYGMNEEFRLLNTAIKGRG
jgi:flagellar basal-body rod protein FlgB